MCVCVCLHGFMRACVCMRIKHQSMDLVFQLIQIVKKITSWNCVNAAFSPITLDHLMLSGGNHAHFWGFCLF